MRSRWPEGRQAAVSLTFDEARRSPAASGYGLLLAWITILLAGRHDAFPFRFEPPTDGVFHYCAGIGYAKMEDYFWTGLTLVGGLAGAMGYAWLAGLAAGWGLRVPNPRLFAITGFICTLAAGLLGFTLTLGGSPWPVALLLCGAVLPLLDAPRWCVPATTPVPEPASSPSSPGGWTTFGLAMLSAVWVWDPRLLHRAIDGPHEGVQSVFLQSLRAGDVPDLGVHTVYGSLTTYSLHWWTALAGVDLGSVRAYFLAVVFAGTFLHLLLVRDTGAPRTVRLLGGWLMLTLSTAAVTQYGWSNPLRTAVPLWSLWFAVDGFGRGSMARFAAAGGLAAVAIAYSPEFGAAGTAAVLALFAAGIRRNGVRRWIRALAMYAAAGAAAYLLLHLAMHGPDFVRAARESLQATYAGARLAGHGARPLPTFIWWRSWAQVRERSWILVWSAGIWLPLLLCGVTGARLLAARSLPPTGRDGLLLGLTVFTALAQLPVIARPLGQQAESAPPAILLLTVALGPLWTAAGRRRATGLAAGAALAVAAFVATRDGAGAVRDRLTCAPVAATGAAWTTGRLGAIRVAAAGAAGLDSLVRILRDRCRPDQRVFFAAPWHAHACFLADRAALPPFPLANLAGTGADVRRMIESLDALAPPLAVVGLRGLDVPFSDEFPELWTAIQRRYRLIKKIDDVLVFERLH